MFRIAAKCHKRLLSYKNKYEGAKRDKRKSEETRREKNNKKMQKIVQYMELRIAQVSLVYKGAPRS